LLEIAKSLIEGGEIIDDDDEDDEGENNKEGKTS